MQVCVGCAVMTLCNISQHNTGRHIIRTHFLKKNIKRPNRKMNQTKMCVFVRNCCDSIDLPSLLSAVFRLVMLSVPVDRCTYAINRSLCIFTTDHECKLGFTAC